VGPAVVSNDVMVVPLAVHLDKAGSSSPSSSGFGLDLVWNGTDRYTGADGVRLVDFDAGTVQETFKASSESTLLMDKEPDVTLHALFKPVDASTINVLVPESGLFEGVPVVRDGKLSAEAREAVDRARDTESSPDPVALETFTASVDGASDTRVTGKSVTITLASDVLFDSDSADLSAQADTTLKKAADQLSTYPGGQVTIVGHTDDVADDAHNQDLSQRRAQAVSDRLGQLASMSAYSVSVSGTGEREPRFFSQAIEEAGFADEVLREETPIAKEMARPTMCHVICPELEATMIEVSTGPAHGTNAAPRLVWWAMKPIPAGPARTPA